MCLTALGAPAAAIDTIAPISGTEGFRTTVLLQLYNAKSLNAFLCRFIPRWHVSSWEDAGWNDAMSFTQTTSVVDVIDGQYRQGVYRIPADVPAGFLEPGIIQCAIPVDLQLAANAVNATVRLTA